jgi:hypothetical protein
MAHAGKHADKGLVNVTVKAQSTLLVNTDFDLTGYDKVADVTDSSATPGLWHALRGKGGKRDKELRLLLTCVTQPQKKDSKDAATDGTLTITLTNTSTTDTQVVTQPVDYATDAPAPP